jgi:hypothetical protein
VKEVQNLDDCLLIDPKPISGNAICTAPRDGFFIFTNMSKNRYINTKFWDDDYIAELEPLSKLVFIYLLTNANTNIAGVYEITIKRIAYDTGIDREYVKEIISQLKQDGKIDREGDYVALSNFFKHQDYKGKRLEGAKQIINSLPEAVKQMPCVIEMQYHIDTLCKKEQPKQEKDDTVSIGYGYSIDTISPNYNSNSNSNVKKPIINNKQEENFARPKSRKDQELLEFFINNGSTHIEAERFFDHYDSQNWMKANNMPISSWHSAASSWITKSIHDPTLRKKNEDPDEEARRLYGVKL